MSCYNLEILQDYGMGMQLYKSGGISRGERGGGQLLSLLPTKEEVVHKWDAVIISKY